MFSPWCLGMGGIPLPQALGSREYPHDLEKNKKKFELWKSLIFNKRHTFAYIPHFGRLEPHFFEKFGWNGWFLEFESFWGFDLCHQWSKICEGEQTSSGIFPRYMREWFWYLTGPLTQVCLFPPRMLISATASITMFLWREANGGTVKSLRAPLLSRNVTIVVR